MTNQPGFDQGQDNQQAPGPSINQEPGQSNETGQPSGPGPSGQGKPSPENIKKWLILIVAVLIVIVVPIFFFVMRYRENRSVGQNQMVPEATQTTETTETAEGSTEGDFHYLGILPLHNPSVMVNQFKGVESFLNENTSLKVKLRLYPTTGELGGYTAVVKDVSEGKISFAYLASVTTVQANGNGPVIPFACAQKGGSPTYRGDLVVRADSPYQSLEDLKGKKVSGTSKSSTSGNLMPSSWLKSLEIDPTTYFEGGMMYLGSHDKAIQAVIKGTIDGAFINESTKNKFNKDGEVVRSIWRHAPVPEFPFVVNTDKVSEAQLAEVKTALLRMHETSLEDIQRIEPKYEKWVELNWEDCLDIKAAIDDVYGPIFYDLEKWGK